MPYNERLEVYTKMEHEYGRNARIAKIIEELSELIKELSKVGQNTENVQKLCDEIADVKIGIEQLEIFFAPNKVIIPIIIDFKIARTKNFYLNDKNLEQ